jgi:hypothetical protein
MKSKTKSRLVLLGVLAILIVVLLRMLTGGGGTPVQAASGAAAIRARFAGVDGALARVQELERREAANSAAGSRDKPNQIELGRLRSELEHASQDSLSYARAALREGDADALRAALESLRRLARYAPPSASYDVETTIRELERRVGAK